MPAETPRVLCLIADGTEEMEVTIVVDLLRRAEVDVVLAGVDGPDPVVCSRGVRIVPDTSLAAAAANGDFELIVLPGGGEGSRRLAQSAAVGRLLAAQESAGRGIAAICAAPEALCTHGVAKGRAMTSHPSVEDAVARHGRYHEESVVEDGPLVTSRGPGTAFEFALALVTRLRGKDVAARVRAPMMFPT